MAVVMECDPQDTKTRQQVANKQGQLTAPQIYQFTHLSSFCFLCMVYADWCGDLCTSLLIQNLLCILNSPSYRGPLKSCLV